jgi:hypothetical protein
MARCGVPGWRSNGLAAATRFVKVATTRFPDNKGHCTTFNPEKAAITKALKGGSFEIIITSHRTPTSKQKANTDNLKPLSACRGQGVCTFPYFAVIFLHRITDRDRTWDFLQENAR